MGRKHCRKRRKCWLPAFSPFPAMFSKGCFFWYKLKTVADDKINENQKHEFFMGWIENIAGKGGNAGYQHFLLFLQCIQKAVSSGLLKVGIVW